MTVLNLFNKNLRFKVTLSQSSMKCPYKQYANICVKIFESTRPWVMASIYDSASTKML